MRSDLCDKLYDAIERGDRRDVKALSTAGADVNHLPPGGWAPLRLATELERVAIARLLLDSRADVNLADSQG